MKSSLSDLKKRGMAADELLVQPSKETCLYKKIAICESLEKGSIKTAEKTVDYLGAIGNKLPVLMDVLQTQNTGKGTGNFYT